MEVEPSLSIEQPESQTDFLLPVHVRQDDTSLQDQIIPLISRWNVAEKDDDDSIPLHHSNDFYRICPFNDPDQIASPRVQV